MDIKKERHYTEGLHGENNESKDKAIVLSKGYEVLCLTDENVLTSCNNCRSQRMFMPDNI